MSANCTVAAEGVTNMPRGALPSSNCGGAADTTPIPVVFSEASDPLLMVAEQPTSCATCATAFGVIAWIVVFVNCIQVIAFCVAAYQQWIERSGPHPDDNGGLAALAFYLSILLALNSVGIILLAIWALHREYSMTARFSSTSGNVSWCWRGCCRACCVITCVLLFLITCLPTSVLIGMFLSALSDTHQGSWRTPEWRDLLIYNCLVVTIAFAVFAIMLCTRVLRA